MKFEIGNIIAERELEAEFPDTTRLVVRVILGQPQKMPHSSDFFAPYLITGCGAEKLWYMAGVDAFQALQLALKVMGAELKAFEKRHNVKLFWEGDDSGLLGFDD